MVDFYRRARSVVFTLLGLISLIGFFIIYLIVSESGLNTLLASARWLTGNRLNYTQANGSLIHHPQIKDLSYYNSEFSVYINHLTFQGQWHRLSLITFAYIIADSVNIKVHHSDTSVHPSLNLKLPFEIDILNLYLKRLNFAQDSKKLPSVNNVYFSAALTNQRWQIKSLAFASYQQNITIKGYLKPLAPYKLDAWLTVYSQNFDKKLAQAHLNGDISLYRGQGSWFNPKITAQGTFKNGQDLQTLIAWNNLKFAVSKQTNLELTQGKLAVAGRFPELKLNLISKFHQPFVGNLALTVQNAAQKIILDTRLIVNDRKLWGRFAYDFNHSPHIQGTIQSEMLTIPGMPVEKIVVNGQCQGDSIKDLSALLTLKGKYLSSGLFMEVRYRHQQILANLLLDTNRVTLKGHLPYTWNIQGVLDKPQSFATTLTNLHTRFDLNGQITAANQGQLILRSSAGYYQLVESHTLNKIPFLPGEITLKLNSKGLKTQAHYALDAAKKLVFQAHLPTFSLDKPFNRQQPLQAQASLSVNSLDFLSQLTPFVTKVQGKLSAVLTAKGSLENPKLKGDIRLTQGEMSIKFLGLELKNIGINLLTQASQWQLKGLVSSANNPLNIAGNGVFTPHLQGNITLKGNTLLMVNTPEYVVYVSPDLTVHLDGPTQSVQGKIIIPKASVKPQTFTDSVTLTEDVQTDDNKPQENAWHIASNVTIEMGKEVALMVKGLQGFLTGAVTLNQSSQGPLTASGELRIKDGVYKAYGQNLVINQSQLTFSGSSIDNPSLHLRAVRQFNNADATFAGSNQLFDFNSANIQSLDLGTKTTVGIELTGRLQTPKVQLFSIPSNLSQADILSMLILGRPANQASKSGGQLLLTAITALNLDKGVQGTQLLSQLKQNLGLDFNLENSPQFNSKTNQITDQNSFVIGKSLSKRFYLSYNLGLSQTNTNVLVLKYLLNKFFSIQVSTSTDSSGIDFLYTHQQE